MPKLNIQKSERLIATVRGYKALYDPSQKDYSDPGAKAKLWNQVAKKCGIKTGSDAKRMWKNLRDCYRISRNKLHHNPNRRIWQFYKDLDFLAPYTKEHKVHHRSGDVVPIQMIGYDKIVDQESQENAGLGGFTTIQFWKDSDNNPDTTETKDQVPKVRRSTEELPSDGENGSETRESYDNILPSVFNHGRVDNSLKMFFDAMYASSIQLPLPLQRKVKNILFKAVLEAEEENEELITSTSNSTDEVLKPIT